MVKKMNVLVASLAILTSWITWSMESKVMSKEVSLETVAVPERAGSWVRFFEETVPGYRFPETGFHPKGEITKVLTQEVLRKRPQMREYILSQIAVPFKEYVGHTDVVGSAEFNRTGDKVVTALNNGTSRIWDLGALLEIESFLAEDIMLQQVALLFDIFDVMAARHYLTVLVIDNSLGMNSRDSCAADKLYRI